MGLLDSIGILVEKKLIWNMGTDTFIFGENSSISDSDSYLRAVSMATIDDKFFSNFRRCLEYRQILEHISYKQSLRYKKILKNRGFVYQNMDSLKTLNKVGSPIKLYYPPFKISSPTKIGRAHV